MTPQHILRDLCRRHGLPMKDGQRLLPLIDRALESPPNVRSRLLRLVDRSLEKRAAEQGDRPTRGDRQALVAVARVLHKWNPGGDLFELGQELDGELEDS